MKNTPISKLSSTKFNVSTRNKLMRNETTLNKAQAEYLAMLSGLIPDPLTEPKAKPGPKVKQH